MIGKRVGYVRVSTLDQNPDRQLEGVELDKKFVDYASAKDTNRPQLQLMFEYLRENDQLFIHSTDRFARSVKDLCNMVDSLVAKKVEVHFVRQNLTFNGSDCPMAKFQLAILGAVAELEREIAMERIREGIAQAKKKGKYKGSKKKLSAEQIEIVRVEMNTRKPRAVLAKELGISRFTLHKYIRDIKKTAAI